MRLKLRQDSILRRPWLLASIIVSFGCLSVMMFTLRFVDCMYHTSWPIELLDCIFRKTDVEFYEYTTMNIHSGSWIRQVKSCDHTILDIIPLAIWDLPIWIVHEITGEMSVVGFWDIIWLKVGLLLCILITAVECRKIIRLVKPDADSLLVFPLIFGSFDVLVSTMYAGQNEIVYIMFLVIALRYIISGKIKRFLLFSTLSVTLNPEMLIPVLLMIVLFEKRVLNVALLIGGTYVPSAVYSFLYRSNELYRSNNWNDKANETLFDFFNNDISLSRGGGNVSLFLLVICVLTFYAFAKKKDDTQPYDYIWIISLAMTSMTILSTSLLNSFYRTFFYVPFLCMLIIISKQNIKTNLMLYVIYSFGMGWLCITKSTDCMSSFYTTLDNTYTRKVIEYYGGFSLGKYYSGKIPILGCSGLFAVVCLSVAIILFYINLRSKQEKNIETVRIPKDSIVLLSTLFTPVVLIAFAYMFVDGSVFHKELRFGSAFVEECLLTDGCLRDENQIHYFSDKYIVYENGVCLDNGEDIDCERYIYSNGVSFGPYITLYPGTYMITINGENLDKAGFGCTYSQDYYPYSIDMFNVSVTEDTITYQINIDQNRCIETTINNSSSDVIVLDQIDIQEIRD